MNPTIFRWIVYGSWALLVAISDRHRRQGQGDTEPDLGQSFGLMYALLLAFALPYVPLFNFVNYAPVGTPLSIVGWRYFSSAWPFSSPPASSSGATGARPCPPNKSRSS